MTDSVTFSWKQAKYWRVLEVRHTMWAEPPYTTGWCPLIHDNFAHISYELKVDGMPGDPNFSCLATNIHVLMDGDRLLGTISCWRNYYWFDYTSDKRLSVNFYDRLILDTIHSINLRTLEQSWIRIVR